MDIKELELKLEFFKDEKLYDKFLDLSIFGNSTRLEEKMNLYVTNISEIFLKFLYL